MLGILSCLVLTYVAAYLGLHKILPHHNYTTWLISTLAQFSHSVVYKFLWPHESQHARPPCPSPTPGVHSNSMSIESVMPSSHLILCHLLFLLPPTPPSIRVFSSESSLHMRWPKHWCFSFSIIPSKEIPGLISFRMDWLDLLVVQVTLKSILQQHSSKASIFGTQLSSQFNSHIHTWLLEKP